jgi:polyhydroxyalkanoate synthesis regulator protein
MRNKPTCFFPGPILSKLDAHSGNSRMSTVHGFVEDWIEMRSKLQRQLKMLESKELSEVNVDNNKEATLTRIKKCIDELNALLKEYTRADRT